MSKKAKRQMAVSLVLLLTLLVGGGVYLSVTSGAGAAAQALPDTGKFRVGSELGLERAGFSGRPMVQVFTNSTSPEWPAISACLQDPQIEAEMALFTGVLVDELAEPEVEAIHRGRDGLRVIVRGLNGKHLGGLPAGFSCSDLLNLLILIRREMVQQPEKSPIYARLLETAEPLDDFILRGERERAGKLVDFLKELEGVGSPAVEAAQAKLNQ